jgi:DNA-binding response OmpR family regulator
MDPDQLRGHRILVVEDDALLAMAYEEILKDAGAEIIGPAGTLEEAGKLAAANGISAALLDIRLGDDEVWPVARLLAGKGVPFAFCTGHFSADTLSPEWAGRPILTKPARPQHIITALTELLTD